MKINWLLTLPLLLLAGFVGLGAGKMWQEQRAQSQGIEIASLRSAREGLEAPVLDLQALGTTPVLTPEDLRGNGLVILNFWASWCPPCRAEHPTLAALAEAGNPLYGVNYRDQPANALAFLDELGNPYDLIGTDPEARAGRDWGVVAMPETFFINDEGVVIYHFRGPVVPRSLESQILPALRERGYDLILPEALDGGGNL